MLYLHRLGGRVYVVCAVLASLGGLGFILQTPVLAGGVTMTVSFAIYGFLVLGSAIMTYRTAKAKDFEAHRRWALRVFTMGICSLIYRVFMAVCTGIGLIPLPTEDNLEGRLDGTQPLLTDHLWAHLNAWLFWIVPLMFIEWYMRAKTTSGNLRCLDVLFIVIGFMAVGFGLTYLLLLWDTVIVLPAEVLG